MKSLADVFISYAHADKALAAAFADVLIGRGWTVWWDRDIGAGTFRRAITNELIKAKCVVVLWSGASANSEFVWNEASRAQKRDVLVPILIEETEIPIGFEERQTFSLLGWEPGSVTPELENVIANIAAVLQQPAPPPEPYPARFWINVALLLAFVIGAALWLQIEVRPLIDGRLFVVAAIAAAALIAFETLFVVTKKHSRRATWTLIAAATVVVLAHFLTPHPLQLIRVAAGKNLFRYLNSTTDKYVLSVTRDGALLIDRKPFTTFQTIYLGAGGDATDAEIHRRNGDEEHKRQLSEYLRKLDANIIDAKVKKLTEFWIARTSFWETRPLRRNDDVEVRLATKGGATVFSQKVERKPGEVVPTVFIEAPQ